VTCLPWDRPPVEAAAGARSRAASVSRNVPTHVVYAGQAYRLGGRVFHLGAEVTPAEFGVQLASSLAAVSRRHCTIRVDAGRVLLHDHSRFGTRLNGEPIEGSAVLHAGDVIQVGQPAVELLLVAEVAADAETA
jgi:pSer/pThr/pTyr-binding forkhead associated (FHA) protein